LEESNPNHIDNGNEETEAERNDQNPFLLVWKPHPRQDWHREKQDRQVGDDINGGRGEVERDDVDTMCIRADR